MTHVRWRIGSPEIHVDDALETLTPIEVRLLDRLVAAGSAPVARKVLLEDVWEYNPDVRTRAVHHSVTRLRKKLGRDAILTLRGAGYRLGPGWEMEERSPAPAAEPGPTRGLDTRVAAVDEALERVGWLCLVGVAGSGRTRLARAVARNRPDVVWVDLAGADVDAVAPAVARALGLERPVTAAVARALAHRGAVLLVLDDLADPGVLEVLAPGWLGGGGSARILVTTPGPVPEPARSIPVTGLDPAPAAALYLDRMPEGSRVDEGAVDRLVRLLDGHPRAIVLAAARAPLLPPDLLADRIEADPATEASPVGAIRAAVDASWTLLPSETRALVAAASVFEGVFTGVDLAEVAGVSEDSVVEGLRPLLNSGLLVLEDGDLRLGRWVRLRAGKSLVAAGRREVVERVHVAWVCSRCREARARLHGPDHAVALARLGALRPDALAALERAGDVDPGSAAELLGALDPWNAANLAGSVHAALWDGIDLDGLQPAQRAVALRHRAHARVRGGRSEAAGDDLDRALVELADPDHQASCRALQVGLALAHGEVDRARALVVLSTEGAGNRPRFVLASLRGTTGLMTGDRDEAERAYAEALDLARRAEDRAAQGLALGWLGNLALQRGHVERARGWFEEGIRTLEPLGAGEGLASALGNAGVCLLESGRPEEATARYRRSLSVARAVGSALLEHTARLGLALVHLSTGEPVRALTELDAVDSLEGGTGALYAEIAAFRALARHRAGLSALVRPELERARARAAGVPDPSPGQVVAAVEAGLARRSPGPPPEGATAVVRLAHRLAG